MANYWSLIVLLTAAAICSSHAYERDDELSIDSFDPQSFTEEEPIEDNEDNLASEEDEQNIQKLFYGWKNFDEQEKKDFLEILSIISKPSSKASSTEYELKNGKRYYKSVQFRMAKSSAVVSIRGHWEMEANNDNRKSWIGLFKVGASDDEGIAYAKTNGRAKGYVQFNNIHLETMKGGYHKNAYELRFFKQGRERSIKPSEANKLRVEFMNARRYHDDDDEKTEKYMKLATTVGTVLERVEADGEARRSGQHSQKQMLEAWLRFDEEEQEFLHQVLVEYKEREQMKEEEEEEEEDMETMESTTQNDGKIKLRIELIKATASFTPLLNITKAIQEDTPTVAVYHTANIQE